MLERLSAQFSEPTRSPVTHDQRELRPEDLQTLINIAEGLGYPLENARDMKSPQVDVSSELFAVWYAKENDICILEDNIPNVIRLTGWGLSETDTFNAVAK